MTRFQFLAVLMGLFGAAMTSGTSYSQGKKGPPGNKKDRKDKRDKKGKKDNDNVPGKRWEYSVKKGGQEIEAGTFRAEDRKIFQGSTQLGTYSSTGPGELRLDMEKGKLKGQIELKLIRTDPRPIYAGQWEMADGGTARIQVKFLED